jgi:hypothetical protein
MRSRRILAAVVLAAIAAVSRPTPAEAIPIHVPCPACDTWPVWVQVLLTIVGVVLALAVLYVPVRLSRRARTPRRSLLILLGGWVVLTIGLVVGARVLVLLFPG